MILDKNPKSDVDRYSSYLYLALLLFLGFCIYGQSLNYGFILDDFYQVVNNYIVHSPSQWIEAFANSTISTPTIEGGIYYKPLMTLVYGLIWQIDQGPYYFHLVQLLMHILNSFMIFRLLERSATLPASYCYLIGLLFLCHPINTEAVVFIADLQEPLYTFFGLLALLNLKAFKSYASTGFSFLLLLLSLLSKETGVLFLIIALLYVGLFEKNRIKTSIFFAFTTISIYLFLRIGMASLGILHSDGMQINRISFFERLQTIPKVLMHYIFLYFYPSELSLTQDWFVQKMSLREFWIPLGLVSSITTICIYLSSKSKFFLLFIAWFMLGWGLHSQIVPLDGTVSDRWFYFTFIGLTTTLFLLAHHLSVSRIIIITASVVSILTLSVKSFSRSTDWRDALALYSHDLTVEPDSAYLNNNYGLELIKVKEYEQAIPYFEKTIQLSPLNSNAWYSGWLNLGASYLFLEDFKSAEKYILVAVQSESLKSYKSYLMLLDKQGRRDDFIHTLNSALQKYPNEPVLSELKAAVISN